VNKKFSTRYYLNLVLVDEENRRYFKQQEITIYRLKEEEEALLGNNSWIGNENVATLATAAT
jgi:vacuolar protein sorting-associated protein 26